MPLDLMIGTNIGRTQATGLNYYVDKESGDDGNSGLAPDDAFETIANLPSFAAGMIINLAKGSHWREELEIDADNVAVKSFGAGEDPILDGSDLLANASFSKTAGQTNVYEIDITPEWGPSDWVNAFEDDAFLTRAADLATCDSTPGSCFPSAAAGTITLYVHASDSSDVTANGKVYEATIRAHGLTFGSQSGCSVDGIETCKSLGTNGSLELGPGNRASNCAANFGSTHNVYLRTGCTLTNVTASDIYFGTDTCTLFVANENTPDGEGVTFTNCTADGGNENEKAGGFYSHKNSSGDFGTITATGCSVVNCISGYEFLDTAATIITGCEYTGWTDSACKGIRVSAGTAPLTIDDFTCTMDGGRAVTTGQALELTITDSLFTCTAVALTAIIYTTGALTLTITGTEFVDNDVSTAIYASSADAEVTAEYNTYTDPMRVLSLNASTTYNSDYNSFSEENMRNNVEGAAYLTITDYKTATGQDEHSTVG